MPVVFSAVDAGGNLMLLQRMEGALVGSVEVSAGKAYTAYAFQMPTHELGAASRPGAVEQDMEIARYAMSI